MNDNLRKFIKIVLIVLAVIWGVPLALILLMAVANFVIRIFVGS